MTESTSSTNQRTTLIQQHLWHPYASLPPTYPNIVIDHADGIYIVTQDGTRLIDGCHRGGRVSIW